MLLQRQTPKYKCCPQHSVCRELIAGVETRENDAMLYRYITSIYTTHFELLSLMQGPITFLLSKPPCTFWWLDMPINSHWNAARCMQHSSFSQIKP